MGLLLDITGCAHLFGGEAALAPRSRRPAGAAGLPARAAIADTAGCAWARGALWQAIRRIVPRGETEAAVLPLPIAALRVEPEIVADLQDLGPDPRRRSRRRVRARRSPRASARSCCCGSTRRSAAPTSRSCRGCRCRSRWPSSAFPSRSRARTTCSAPSSIWRASLPRVLERRGEGGRLFHARAVPRRRQGAPARARHRRAAARSPARAQAVRGAARGAGRRLRSGLRLRHGAALGAGHRALRSGADRARPARRPCARSWRT